MNEEKYLIMIKGKDRTKDVDSYEYMDSKVVVTFTNSQRVYEYYLDNVVILDNPQTIEITDDRAVFNEGYPLFNVTHVQNFGSMIRVHFANGGNRVYDSQQAVIKNNGANNSDTSRIMKYFRAISKHVKNEDDREHDDSFLAKEYEKLNFVHPDSVLNHYLHASPINGIDSVQSTYIYPFRYNLSQKDALEQALHNPISVIEGPPGTGKTQTILNILANLAVMQQKTVAVVSGNNAAVDNVREKLEREGYHFIVASLGRYENKERFFANLPNGDVSDWQSDIQERELFTRIADLDNKIQRLMALDREVAALRQQLSAYQLEQEHFEHFYAKKDVRLLNKLSFYRLTPERILEFMKDSFLAVELETDRNMLYKFKLFFKHGFTRFKLLENHGLEVMLDYQRQFYILKVTEITKQITTMEQELAAHSYQRLMAEHQQYSSRLFRHKLHKKYHNRENIHCNVRTYKQGKHFRSFIEHYPIVLSTTHSLRNSVPTNYLFDYCIIDESSQVDLLTGALALSCCRRVIIVGDTKQLPQIVDLKIQDSMDSETLDGISEAYNYFQHNMLSSMLALYKDSLPKVMLREHYRCHPRIIEFCNRKYYDGELISFTKSQEADVPLLIYTTAKGNHMRDGFRGKFNQRELDVIEQEVLQGLIEEAARHADIGFVTPYRHQADRASKQLDPDLESDTIHKYQGREKPIMIMSTVLDRTKFGKMGMRFVNDPCKINVAVSRAQDQFILVTDGEAFRKYGNEIGDLMRYMEYSTLDSNVVESKIISIFDLLYQEYSDKLRDFREKVGKFKSSRHKSENIMHALLEQILQEPKYKDFKLGNQVLLMNLFSNLDILGEEERQFIRHRSSVDFVVYHKFDNSPALAIEVDGFAFHENKPEQLERDKKKEGIFKKFGVDLQRFPTTGSGEVTRIRELLDLHLSEMMERE